MLVSYKLVLLAGPQGQMHIPTASFPQGCYKVIIFRGDYSPVCHDLVHVGAAAPSCIIM